MAHAFPLAYFNAAVDANDVAKETTGEQTVAVEAVDKVAEHAAEELWMQMHPCRGDWTEQVKEDLSDFEIPCSFDYIERKSKETFNKIVKIKAKEYALRLLRRKQDTHSKMENLYYSDIQMQNYLMNEKTTPGQKRTILERFCENYRDGNTPAIYTLCKLPYDNQKLSLLCPEIKKEIIVRGDIK